MLINTRGNLIDLAEAGQFDVIVHGCNCQNTMGSGIAREIRQRYPQAYTADCEAVKNKENKLGTYSGVKVGTFWIINAYTQFHYLPRGVDHFDYTGFSQILDNIYKEFPKHRFGFPYIGMGLAGGNSDRIMMMLEGFASVVNLSGGSVTLVEFVP